MGAKGGRARRLQFQIRLMQTHQQFREWVVGETRSHERALLWRDRMREALRASLSDALAVRVVRMRGRKRLTPEVRMLKIWKGQIAKEGAAW